jgi:hypothetical protein
MRKSLIILAVIATLILVGYGTVFAIQGACVNCHTMHNSQNGTWMADRAAPYQYLLRAGCVACHTQTDAGDGSLNTDYSAPIVWHTEDPTGQGPGNTNAGGDLYWVTSDDRMGHNVDGVASGDTTILGAPTPPGWDQAATQGAYAYGDITGGAGWGTQQVTCAGMFGCHGEHNSTDQFAAIKGAHHGNPNISGTQAVTPTTVGASYRFLIGIQGLEISDWEWGATTALHNEYYGVSDTSGRTSGYSDLTTISFSCAECHGVYHAVIDDATDGSPWLRHPTDIVLPNSGEYSDYNPTTGTFSVEAPVARGAVPASSSSTVNEGATTATGAIVACVSCHRAHGTDQPDILRWDYTGMVANTTGASADTGCFTCHTTKDGT